MRQNNLIFQAVVSQLERQPSVAHLRDYYVCSSVVVCSSV